MLRRSVFSSLALLLASASAAVAAPVPPDATYEQAYIPSASPVPNDNDPTLHADVLRPKGATGKVPVIMTVSPYTNHSNDGGSTFDPGAEGPNDRFFDFVVRDAKVFSKGYAYVIVDLRGTGGSGGCHDWGGPGEQLDVKRAVEWAASQPWSNGKVALYGKSYDAWTGLMGLAMRPKGLSAVISQEPVVSGYRYMWTNGVRVSNTTGTPASFQLFDVTPGTVNDDPQYHTNSAFSNVVKPGCNAQNVGMQSADNNPKSAFWEPRDLTPRVKGAGVPTFYMAGFLEDNTKPDAIFETWKNFATPDSMAWYGQWAHIRGNDKEGNKPAPGRGTFVEEAMRFLDEHLKGVTPNKQDPRITVQDSDGKFRSEAEWPPVDARGVTVGLKGGAYTDNGQNNGDGTGTVGQGVWSISQPLPYDMHLAGVQKLDVEIASSPPRGNLVANLYEIGARDKKATLVSRDAFLLNGAGKVSLELHGQDWIFDRGNRIGVLLSSSNAEWWRHVPTNQSITVKSASITLPFLAFKRTPDLAGEGMSRLSTVKGRAFVVPDSAFTAGATSFALPPEQVPFPRGSGGGGGGSLGSGAPGSGVTPAQAAAAQRAGLRALLSVKTRLLRRTRRAGRRLRVSGKAPRGSRVTVDVLRGKRRVARRRVTARRGTYSVTVRLSRRGRYSVRVSARVGREVLRAPTKRVLARR